jgi:hypothetical protein
MLFFNILLLSALLLSSVATDVPTMDPAIIPTHRPTVTPSWGPTASPTTYQPTYLATNNPTTFAQSRFPTIAGHSKKHTTYVVAAQLLVHGIDSSDFALYFYAYVYGLQWAIYDVALDGQKYGRSTLTVTIVDINIATAGSVVDNQIVKSQDTQFIVDFSVSTLLQETGLKERDAKKVIIGNIQNAITSGELDTRIATHIVDYYGSSLPAIEAEDVVPVSEDSWTDDDGVFHAKSTVTKSSVSPVTALTIILVICGVGSILVLVILSYVTAAANASASTPSQYGQAPQTDLELKNSQSEASQFNGTKLELTEYNGENQSNL